MDLSRGDADAALTVRSACEKFGFFHGEPFCPCHEALADVCAQQCCLSRCGLDTCADQAVMLTVEVVAAVAKHGVDQDLIDRQFAASKAFFALPLGIKLKLKV